MSNGITSLSIIIAVVLIATGFIVFGGFLIMLAWAWVVPDVFAGLVDEGLLFARLTFWQAVKLNIFVSVMLGLPLTLLIGTK